MHIPEQRKPLAAETDRPDTASIAHESFDELYAKYYRTVVGLLTAKGAGSHAEDIAQETFVKALSHIDRYTEQGKVLGWLSVIAVNTFFDFCRYNNSRPLDFTDEPTTLDRVAPAQHSDPALLTEEAHAHDELYSSIFAELDDSHVRDVFILLAEGYTNSEISEILGIPRSTVGTKILRGREVLTAAGVRRAS